MGQQTSRQNCTCGCGAWERRARFPDAPESAAAAAPAPAPAPAPLAPPAITPTSIHRYVSAVTERGAGAGCAGGAPAECSCRRRRWPLLPLRRPRPACVCTAYRRVTEAAEEEVRPASADEARACRGAAAGLLQRCTTCRDDQLAAVLALGARELRRELDALVGISSSGEADSAEGGGVEGSGAAELFLWSVAPHAHPDFTNLDPEDLEERARARRALEIAQGVEAPPGFRPQFQVVCNGELRALLLRAPSAAAAPAPAAAAAPLTRVHTQVDYIHCLVPDLKEITACCFYWGKMDRYEAERLLDNKPEGTFLLRDSAQEEHLFSVSFRKYGRSLHARIEHFNHKFSFDSHDPAVFSAPTVTTLIHHYKDPACVMFFEPMLTAPLPRTSPFSLQQLARAVIVSSTTYDGVEALPLPARLRAYLKEYHYRQRVRVRRLDSLACLHGGAPDPALA